jgi:DNA-binding transcriptional regulator YiaG
MLYPQIIPGRVFRTTDGWARIVLERAPSLIGGGGDAVLWADVGVDWSGSRVKTKGSPWSTHLCLVTTFAHCVCLDQFRDEPEQAKIIRMNDDNDDEDIGGNVLDEQNKVLKNKILTPVQIVSIRKRLGLSQSELEGLLGLGSKVVTRWETGRVVPGRVADRMLRILDENPAILDSLRRIRDDIG